MRRWQADFNTRADHAISLFHAGRVLSVFNFIGLMLGAGAGLMMVLESENIQWEDKFLNLVDVETLFGATAEKVVETIIQKIH